jgi:hypothetical protein
VACQQFPVVTPTTQVLTLSINEVQVEAVVDACEKRIFTPRSSLIGRRSPLFGSGSALMARRASVLSGRGELYDPGYCWPKDRNRILTEFGSWLITEAGDHLVLEMAVTTTFGPLLTEEGVLLLTEAGDVLVADG